MFDWIAAPAREGQFSPPKLGWTFQPRLHVCDSAEAQYKAAKEVFEIPEDLEHTSLRRQYCFVHAAKIWMNHAEHVRLLRDAQNLDKIKNSLNKVKNSVFVADRAHCHRHDAGSVEP